MERKKNNMLSFLNVVLVLLDILIINFSYLLALFLRFDNTYSLIPESILKTFISMVPIHTIVTVLVFYVVKMYKSLWRYASVPELVKIFVATIVSGFLNYFIITMFFTRMPISYYVVGSLLQFIFTSATRFITRLYMFYTKPIEKHGKNTLIIGAGEAGKIIYNDLVNNGYNVKAFIDDKEYKINKFINGVEIVGDRTKIIETVKKLDIDTVVIAMPSAEKKEIKEILEISKESQAKLKILPSIDKMISGEKISLSQLKDVKIEDLLERTPINIYNDKSFEYLENKIVLVTGGGGTIGSELCRQIASKSPRQLIIFDIYENNAYEIEQELNRKFPGINLVTLIGSVREQLRLDNIFQEYRPDIVYHAAAHKHVPLMETSPDEAVKNNIFGTYNTAYVALKYDVERFILISTDKAVNPTNIMGATKRVCEMIVQNFNHISIEKNLKILPYLRDNNISDSIKIDYTKFRTEFVAVRFGNVLGSNGSVIPLFKKQIADGGPVLVTHKDIVRYFMTIQEAVSLVIQAGSYARGGEIFVLDMGAPVKIDTLARNLIKLSGLKPDVDIKIDYVGLRPGEKLYEEKLIAEEGLSKTENELIHIAKPLDSDKDFFKMIEKLYFLAKANKVTEVIEIIKILVPTYHTPESDMEINKEKIKKYLDISK